jgi:hypothetical protein
MIAWLKALLMWWGEGKRLKESNARLEKELMLEAQKPGAKSELVEAATLYFSGKKIIKGGKNGPSEAGRAGVA